MKYLPIITITLMALLISPLQAAKNDEVLVQRKVVILDFVNLAKDKSVEYLKISIPEALLSELKSSKNFELISRSKSNDIVKQQKLKGRDLFSDNKAVAVGKAAGADVVVVGNFTKSKSNIRIQAKAIETDTSRIAVSKIVTGKADSTIFTTIEKMAKKMSREMKDKLPPIPQREIIKDNKTQGNAIMRSALLPGWGQNYLGYNIKSYIMFGIDLSLVGGITAVAIMRSQAVKDYEALEEGTEQSIFDDKFNKTQTLTKTLNILAVVAASYYLFNLLDVSFLCEVPETNSMQNLSFKSTDNQMLLSYSFRY